MIIAENLSFSYRLDDKLLDKLNFVVNNGERIAITGENGTGKTSLLKIIAGIEKSYSGLISNTFSKISFVPTVLNNFLLPWYSIEENIAFFESSGEKTTLHSYDNYNEILGELMPKFDKNIFYKKKIYEISSGQKAVLSIICSLSNIPDLIILDETFSNLSTTQANKLIKYLKSKNLTVIFSSHSNHIVEEFSTNIFNITLNRMKNSDEA
jgi:ABC-type multidrug transport system ATPase subunit